MTDATETPGLPRSLTDIAKKIVEQAGRPTEEDLPPFLDRKVVMTPEQIAASKAAVAKQVEDSQKRIPAMPRPIGAKEQQIREMRHEEKKAKSRGRIEKLKAKLTGKAAAMPLTGKAALAVIDAKSDGDVVLQCTSADLHPSIETPAKAPGAPKPRERPMKASAKTKSKPAAAKPAKKPVPPKPAARARAAQANARTPAGARADGLKVGSKQAKMLDFAAAAPRTEAEICKHIGGWKACATTLRRVCDKVGAKVERKDGAFVVTLKK